MAHSKNSPAQRMRIARITTTLNISGPSLQTILLTAGFTQAGHETLLIAGEPWSGDSMEGLAQRYGVQPRLVPLLHRTLNPWHNLRALWRLYRILRELHPDIVHTHGTTAGFLGRLAARLAGVPVVVHTLHVHPFRGYYDRVATFFFIWIERIGALLSDSILTLSEGLRRELVETYHITSRKRINVLPLGFDLARFAETPRQQGIFRATCKIPPRAPLVGIVGRLLPVKNHALFLQAAALIHQARPDVCFVIVGDGAEGEALRVQAQALGLAENVIFAGWQDDMPAVYSDLDVLVSSSHNEGMPVPLLEALVAGVPVAATAVGGIPDLLEYGRAGLLVPPGDAAALAQATLSLLDAPGERESIRASLLARYSIDALVQDLESLYRGLLMRRR